jgi:phage gp45-like
MLTRNVESTGTHESSQKAPSGSERLLVVSSEDGAEVVVASPDGTTEIEIALCPDGVTLRLRGARLAIAASEELTLESKRVRIRATEKLDVSAGEVDIRAAHRTTKIVGRERLEAGSIEAQSSHGSYEVRAERAIRLDGERIGLNDQLATSPFDWSDRAREGSE